MNPLIVLLAGVHNWFDEHPVIFALLIWAGGWLTGYFTGKQ